MKTRFVRFSLPRYLSLIFVLLLFSCEKDSLEDNTTDIATEKTVVQRPVNYDDFNSNKELFRLIAKKRNSVTQNRPGDGQLIELDYSSGVYFEDHEYHSYTFPLLNPTAGENLTNIFFSFQSDGTYRIFMVEYGHTAKQIESLKLGGTITPEIFTYTEIDENFQALYTVQCTSVTMTVSYCALGNHPGGYPADSNCGASDSYTVSYGTFCDGVGTDSFPGSTYPSSSGTTSSGGGGGPNQTTTPTTGCRVKNCLDYEISMILGYLNLQNELIDTVNDLSQSAQVEILNFIQQNLDENGSILPEAESYVEEVLEAYNNETLITAFPLVKYPEGSNYAVQYPKLTQYLKNQLPTVKNNSIIVNAIQTYTSLSELSIEENLSWGSGPTIRIEQLGNNIYGEFRKQNDPNSLYIDIDLVNSMENTNPGSESADSFIFLIGVTILHEFVHYGDYNYNGDTWNYPQEEGLLFEQDVYGQTVWLQNAKIILKDNQ